MRLRHGGLLSLWDGISKRAGRSQKRPNGDQRGGIIPFASFFLSVHRCCFAWDQGSIDQKLLWTTITVPALRSAVRRAKSSLAQDLPVSRYRCRRCPRSHDDEEVTLAGTHQDVQRKEPLSGLFELRTLRYPRATPRFRKPLT